MPYVVVLHMLACKLADSVCFAYVFYVSGVCLSMLVFVLASACVCAALLYECPGGNQVDGLPPAFHLRCHSAARRVILVRSELAWVGAVPDVYCGTFLWSF